MLLRVRRATDSAVAGEVGKIPLHRSTDLGLLHPNHLGLQNRKTHRSRRRLQSLLGRTLRVHAGEPAQTSTNDANVTNEAAALVEREAKGVPRAGVLASSEPGEGRRATTDSDQIPCVEHLNLHEQEMGDSKTTQLPVTNNLREGKSNARAEKRLFAQDAVLPKSEEMNQGRQL